MNTSTFEKKTDAVKQHRHAKNKQQLTIKYLGLQQHSVVEASQSTQTKTFKKSPETNAETSSSFQKFNSKSNRELSMPLTSHSVTLTRNGNSMTCNQTPLLKTPSPRQLKVPEHTISEPSDGSILIENFKNLYWSLGHITLFQKYLLYKLLKFTPMKNNNIRLTLMEITKLLMQSDRISQEQLDQFTFGDEYQAQIATNLQMLVKYGFLQCYIVHGYPYYQFAHRIQEFLHVFPDNSGPRLSNCNEERLVITALQNLHDIFEDSNCIFYFPSTILLWETALSMNRLLSTINRISQMPYKLGFILYSIETVPLYYQDGTVEDTGLRLVAQLTPAAAQVAANVYQYSNYYNSSINQVRDYYNNVNVIPSPEVFPIKSTTNEDKSSQQEDASN
jgi:hypothetical protein